MTPQLAVKCQIIVVIVDKLDTAKETVFIALEGIHGPHVTTIKTTPQMADTMKRCFLNHWVTLQIGGQQIEVIFRFSSIMSH